MKTINFMSLSIVLLFLAGIIGCASGQSQSGGQEAGKPTVAIKVAQIRTSDLPVTLAAPGNTYARREEKILAPVAGTIVALNVLEGNAVTKGQVVASIRTRESQAAIDGAKALVESAVSAGQKAAAEAALRLADSTQTVIDVKSGSDGVVSARHVSEGELVSDGNELLSVIDLSTLEFEANAPIRDLANLHVGQEAMIRLTALPQLQLGGVLYAVDPQSDQQSQTARIRLQFKGIPEPERRLLKTNLSGVAQVTIAIHRGALLLPRSALLRNDETNEYSIFTVTADSLAMSLPVQVGSLTDSLAEVTGDKLSDGLSVIIEGNYALVDSTRVTISATQTR